MPNFSGDAEVGEDVFVLRIPIILSDVPFKFRRLQFLLSVTSAVSVNTARRPPFSAGVDLRTGSLFLLDVCVSFWRIGGAEKVLGAFAKLQKKATISFVVINKIQQDATVCRYLFTAKLRYMFRVSIAPIIRST